MPEITLPDKSKRKFEKPLSIEDLASDIGPCLAKVTVAGKTDGVLVDASEIVTKDAEIEIITVKDDSVTLRTGESKIEVVRTSVELVITEGEERASLDLNKK